MITESLYGHLTKQINIMKDIIISSTKLVFFLLPFLLMGCDKDEFEFGPEIIRQFGAESALVQEVRFSSQVFTVVGDLRFPVEGDQHPVIMMIHGSGEATRRGAVDFVPMIEMYLKHGYAVFSWDKPGSGESKGDFTQGYTITERAKIIRDAIGVLAENPSVDPTMIGLWGISQAGWVMPMALKMTDAIDFMIVVSGGGEDGIEQGAYQTGQRFLCDGGSAEDAAIVEQYWAVMNKAAVYDEYRTAVKILLEIPWIVNNTPVTLTAEENWNPWPREIDAFFDPTEVLRETTIPVLAFFGELDKNIDPVQGAQAYQSALSEAGNQDFQVIVIPGAGHVMTEVETGCIGESAGSEYMTEYLETLDFWLMDR
jgi:pimeloyl-ACP methyl ester carboxylesterase